MDSGVMRSRRDTRSLGLSDKKPNLGTQKLEPLRLVYQEATADDVCNAIYTIRKQTIWATNLHHKFKNGRRHVR